MDKDFLDDLDTDDEESVVNDILPEEPTPAKADATAKSLEELDRKSKGFYDSMKAERAKRQELQSELDRIKGTVNAILEMKRAQPADVLADTPKFKGMPVKETEDGELFVPTEHVDNVIAPYKQKIADLEQRLQQTDTRRDMDNESMKVIQSIVGEDESYGPAYNKYQAARKWANDRVVDFQKENGLRTPMTSGQALDAVFSDETEKEFASRFPGLNIEDVVRAEDSRRDFRKMLKNVSGAMNTPKKPTDERFRRVLNKPSGLGSATNVKGGKLSISERAADLSGMDLMELSDAQVKMLEDALRKEEKSDGISW